MPLRSRISSLWRNLAHKRRVDEELDEELRACLEILAEQKMESGLSPRPLDAPPGSNSGAWNR